MGNIGNIGNIGNVGNVGNGIKGQNVGGAPLTASGAQQNVMANLQQQNVLNQQQMMIQQQALQNLYGGGAMNTMNNMAATNPLMMGNLALMQQGLTPQSMMNP